MIKFKSKILLFGEYTVLNGSKALAVPFKQMHGQLVVPEKRELTKEEQESNQSIQKLAIELKNQKFIADFNQKLLASDLALGLFFESNIPQGYGLGSSGALSAAIYHHYFTNQPTELEPIKSDLARIESFFHGNSSGTDPLVSYIDRAVLLNPDREMCGFEYDNAVGMFLIDTEQARVTEKLIPIYNKKYKGNPEFHAELVKQTNVVIDAYFAHSPFLYTEIQHLCILQNHFLPEMFVLPKALENYKLEFGEMLSLKLCGAGGGGYLLAFTSIHYHKEVLEKLHQLGVKTVEISPPKKQI